MRIEELTEDLIDAIRRIRREISDLFDGNIMAIAEDAAQRQALSNRLVWQLKANHPIVKRELTDDNSMSIYGKG